MTYHVLNGDSLGSSFPDAKIAGEVVIMREGLIDGDVQGNNLQEIVQARAAYMEIPYEEYKKVVVTEFEKILAAPNESIFNLWFEYDLFCQVNMWFILSLLHELSIQKEVFAVYTTFFNKGDKNFWNGFGPATTNQLHIAFNNRIQLSDADIQLGYRLWKAYQKNDLVQLQQLAAKQSAAFPYLQEVVQAHIDRFPKEGKKGRPEQVIEAIIAEGSGDFNTVFRKFWQKESIYGFGDVQLKHIYDKVIAEQ